MLSPAETHIIAELISVGAIGRFGFRPASEARPASYSQNHEMREITVTIDAEILRPKEIGIEAMDGCPVVSQMK